MWKGVPLPIRAFSGICNEPGRVFNLTTIWNRVEAICIYGTISFKMCTIFGVFISANNYFLEIFVFRKREKIFHIFTFFYLVTYSYTTASSMRIEFKNDLKLNSF